MQKMLVWAIIMWKTSRRTSCFQMWKLNVAVSSRKRTFEKNLNELSQHCNLLTDKVGHTRLLFFVSFGKRMKRIQVVIMFIYL